jgi:hypothetical protein
MPHGAGRQLQKRKRTSIKKRLTKKGALMPSTTQTRRNTDSGSPSTRSRSASQGTSLSEAASNALESFQEYARERPDVVALWCFGIGFVLGWKLKPW